MDQPLERFHPILMHSLLTSARRFDPGLYDSLCRRFNLDADRILGLFKEVEDVGSGQIGGVLEVLRGHTAYHEMVFLAGRNSLLGWSEANKFAMNHKGGAERFEKLARTFLPDFLGRATFHQMQRGRVIYIEVRNSIFARGVQHANPVCGFYAGFLSELGVGCTGQNCAVSEVRCCAAEHAPSCMFAVPL